ncbi:MAG: AgmX/PglI C-terminal domain-containing protein [Bdellovibrionota bacterium]
MIAISTANGELIKIIHDPKQEDGISYGYHRLFGFVNKKSCADRLKNRRRHGLQNAERDQWLCRFDILPKPDTPMGWSIANHENCTADHVSDGQWKLSTPFGEFTLSTLLSTAAVDPWRLGTAPLNHDRTLKTGFVITFLLLLLIPFMIGKDSEPLPPPVLEPITVNVIQERQHHVSVSVNMPQVLQTKDHQVRRAVAQNLGFLGLLGKKDLNKALGGMPTELTDASPGAGMGGKEGSGGELLVGIGQGVKRTTVGNTGVAGLGGIGTKGAGGGAGGYGNSMVGSGDGRALSSIPVSQDIMLEGGLDRSVIQATIAKYISQVRACYEGGLRKNPGLSGQVTMQFEINGLGGLNFSRVNKSSLGNNEVEQCISNRMMTWQFPKPLGGVSVKVSYPFLLRPAGS